MYISKVTFHFWSRVGVSLGNTYSPTCLVRLSSSQSQLHDLLIYSSKRDIIKQREIENTKKKFQERLESESVDVDLIQRIRHKNWATARKNFTGENIPVALQFLYNDATKVQGSQVIEEKESKGKKDTEQDGSNFFPFAIYDEQQKTIDTNRPRLGRKGRARRKEVLEKSYVDSNSNSISEQNNDFEAITGDEETKKMLCDDAVFKYGTSDPSVPSSKVPCGKCGAFLHCQDPKSPGFIPAELFIGRKKQDLRYLNCQRCYIMETYNIALKMSVSPEFYPKTIAHLRKKKAIVVLVVDLSDFPGSVWPDIMDLLGKGKRIVLVGNKVDLLPQDCHKYLSNVRQAMEKSFFKKCEESGLGFKPKVFESILVSARTGFNMEHLVSKIFKFWQDFEAEVGGDIYLVGTTNVGKSSIFNLLLDSDLCKVKAVNRVEKALTSPVPGTTLNLLKFPIMRPSPDRLSQRITRLIQDRNVMSTMERKRLEMLRAFKDRRFASPLGVPVTNTFTLQQDKQGSLRSTGFSLDAKQPMYGSLPNRLDPHHPEFADGHWCYDTPGSVSEDQIINLLTQEEVMKLLPELPFAPKTFSMMAGRTLFIGGIARIDILEGPLRKGYRVPVLTTVFASDNIPINLVETENAEDFYEKALKSNFLEVPSGDSDRLARFPKLLGQDISVDGYSEYQSSMDIVLSSAGWVSFSPKPADIFSIRAWTPNGKGIFVRDPPFLPFAVQLKGNRLSGTPAYQSGKIFLPDI